MHRKIGQFIYPWGGGHYSRMMKLDRALAARMGEDADRMEVHYSSGGRIYQRLLERFPDKADRIHHVSMPTPIDGGMGPSLSKSLANVLFPVSGNPTLITQIADYMRREGRLYDEQGFDLVINDGDMGSNVLAKNRNVPCLFVTNQFRPRLYRSRAYLYPALLFISKQIAKASKILVADSPPPHTICEYNLNFTDEILQEKVEYVGHFTDDVKKRPASCDAVAGEEAAAEAAGSSSSSSSSFRGADPDLKRLLESGGAGFGYWMRTGDRSTNDGTGRRYEEVFARSEMRGERRLVSHARNEPGIDSVKDADGNRYAIGEAADRGIDWVQIDVGFLSEPDKDLVLDMCGYAVINGSHTVMGEIMGGRAKPIIGVPIYDEHTNNIRWADEHGLGVMANDAKRIISAVRDIKQNESAYADRLAEFSRNFNGRGAQNAAEIAAEMMKG